MSNLIATRETHPNHAVVGHLFAGPSMFTGRTEVYICESEDQAGYWLVNVNRSWDKKNISIRAIGATFHEVQDHGVSWYVTTHNSVIPKADLAPRSV